MILSRIAIHPIRCPICKEPLQHNDLVISGEGQEPTHAMCCVIIKGPNGSVKTIGGVPVYRPPPGAVPLTQEEWSD